MSALHDTQLKGGTKVGQGGRGPLSCPEQDSMASWPHDIMTDQTRYILYAIPVTGVDFDTDRMLVVTSR